MMDLRPGMSVLEIGCGWGGFAEFAAREIGAKVTGITISKEQHDFARQRMFNAGLSDRAIFS
jgi:cyclopropane-fatty-acyl-phospholipid synthase